MSALPASPFGEPFDDAAAAAAPPAVALAWPAVHAGARLVFAPGRVEFLGKHTDYAGGRSLLCATEQGIAFAWTPREDDAVRIVRADTGEAAGFPLRPNVVPAAGHWSNYPMTVARRVARNFAGPSHAPRTGPLRGADITLYSDLPPAAGLSSSSALIVGTFLVLSAANGLDHRPEYAAAIHSAEDLAGYLGTVENGQTFANHGQALEGDLGVGTLGGSQDHTAILCSRPGELRQYGFCPVRFEQGVPFPSGHKLVIAVSGVVAEKTGAARELYNANPLMVRLMLRLWNEAAGRSDPSLAAAVRSGPDAADRMRRVIAGATEEVFSRRALLWRLEQFLEESERIIPDAADALRSGDLAVLGGLVAESQWMAEEGLKNQVPQTVFLSRAARDAGAAAASAFGAGFGGSVWALVPAAGVDDFRHRWMTDYREAFPDEAEQAVTFVTGAGPAAAAVV